MAGDFNKPTIDDLYTAVYTLIRENMAEVSKMLDASTATNIPTGAKRWNATTKRFEKWSGSAWSELLAKATDSFDMRVAQSDDVFLSTGVTAKGQGQLGSVPSSAVTNANSFLLSGTFFVSNATAVTNWPTASVGGFLSVEATADGTYIRQIFTDYNAAKWWVRVSSNAGVAWTAWKDINSYVHNHTLDSLSNVTITANSAGEILKWNGSAWVNNTLAEAGIPLDAIPAGAVLMLARNTAPTGFLKANGAAVSRTTYAALFAAISTTYGAGDGSTTFNLPDLRGEFIRCWDDAKGTDSGRVFASWQANSNLSHAHTAWTDAQGSHSHNVWTGGAGGHSHTVAGTISTNTYPLTDTMAGWKNGTATTSAVGDHTHAAAMDAQGSHGHNIGVAADGGTETRPRNVALLAVIKY